MVHAIRLKEYGEPEVLSWQQVEVGKPAAGQVRIRQTAVGVNFMDVSQRRGRSPIPLALPGGLGGEAAGIIEELGEGVADLGVGDRVVYAGGGAGAYAQARIVPAQILGRTSRRHERPARRRHDAQGHDCAVSRAPDFPRQKPATRCCFMLLPAGSGSLPVNG